MSRINLSSLQRYAIMLVLLALMALFSLASPYFLTLRNLTNIITQNTYFVIVAVGLSFVMIGGGIDLSVGYQMSLVGVATAMLMVVYQVPVWLAVLIGLLLGALLGEQPTRLRILWGASPLSSIARFGRLAYLTYREVTNCTLLRWKSHGCPGPLASTHTG